FVLRDNARFETGKPATSADAVFSLQRAVMLDKAPAVILNAIGLTKDNVAAAVTASVVDKETVLAHEQNKDMGLQWLETHWAGTGPYRLVIWRPNEYYAFEANSKYWGPKPATRRIIVRQVKDASTQRLMLERGDVDYARNLDKDQLAALAKNPSIKFDKGIKSAITYLGLNQKNQYLAKPEVVEALKYLVDYDA